jgi:uncharacterized oligopeptide transporter (OPT) family protein
MLQQGITHAIGTDRLPAPQGTLMATLINGILGRHLDWQFILVGVAIALVMELCSINALSFAIGIYLPLSTTLPIGIGGAIRGLVNMRKKKSGEVISPEEEDLGKGNLFATGLVAGGAIAGVVVAFLLANDSISRQLEKVSLENRLTGALGKGGYYLLGTAMFALMGMVLYRTGIRRSKKLS